MARQLRWGTTEYGPHGYGQGGEPQQFGTQVASLAIAPHAVPTGAVVGNGTSDTLVMDASASGRPTQAGTLRGLGSQRGLALAFFFDACGDYGRIGRRFCLQPRQCGFARLGRCGDPILKSRFFVPSHADLLIPFCNHVCVVLRPRFPGARRCGCGAPSTKIIAKRLNRRNIVRHR